MIPLPGVALLLRLRARRAARARDWAEAARLYRRMAALGQAGPRDRVQLGHALKGSGDRDAAEAAYRAAAAADPLRLDTQRQLGLFLRHNGAPDEAVDVLARALAIDPAAADIREELDELGFVGAAVDERTIAGLLGGVAPASGASAGARAATARGRHALARGDAAGAVIAFRRALLHGPRDPDGYARLAEALAAADHRRAAEQAWLTAWRLRPGHAAASAALADAGWRRDDLARLTQRGWGQPDHGIPIGLSLREKTIWTHLACATGLGD